MYIKVEVLRNDGRKMTERENSLLVPSQKHWLEQPSMYKNNFTRVRNPGDRLQHL